MPGDQLMTHATMPAFDRTMPPTLNMTNSNGKALNRRQGTAVVRTPEQRCGDDYRRVMTSRHSQCRKDVSTRRLSITRFPPTSRVQSNELAGPNA